MAVPCGNCAACLTNRRNDWIVRLVEEAKRTRYAYFLTLTYSDEKINYNDTNGVPSVNKRHLQLYFKKLRKKGHKFRYYAVGEYGTETARPHYHIIMFADRFNNRFLSAIQECWSDEEDVYGFVHFGDVEIRSISYVAKYHVNKTNYPYGADKPFALNSKSIGLNYIYDSEGNETKIAKWHMESMDRDYYPSLDKKKRLPRYYRNKLFDDEKRIKLSVKNKVDEYDFKEADKDKMFFKKRKDAIEAFENKFLEKSNFNNKL